MDNVVRLKGEVPLQGDEAVARVIQFLRSQADALEGGEARPVHKAILIVYENCGDKARTLTAFCNTNVVERTGIMAMALHDVLQGD